MKNIQVVDSASNCAYSIYQIQDDAFLLLFPGKDQDVEFIEDVFERLGSDKAGALVASLWDTILEKKRVDGIHGTLFYGFEESKKFYPSKRESDL